MLAGAEECERWGEWCAVSDDRLPIIGTVCVCEREREREEETFERWGEWCTVMNDGVFERERV